MNKEWEIKRLGDISEIIYGYTEKASFTEIGPKFLRITDIQNNNVYWESVPFCSINDTDYQKYKLNDGDIVFARTGATTGKSYLIKNSPKSVFASYLIKVHLNKGDLLPEFLYLYFQTNKYWETIYSDISGSAQGGFNATKLSQMKIPIPPIPEQKRIVKILDKAFAAINKAKANAEKNLRNSRELFESYLNKVFAPSASSGQRTPGDDWEEKKLGEVCEKITKGSSPKWQGINYVDKPGILFITSKNVRNGELILKKRKYVEEKFNEIEKKSILQNGDVLTNLVGASIGRTAIYNINEMANINQAVGILRCKHNILNNEFLTFLLNSVYFKQILHANEINNARANLSLSFFSNLSIQFPSLQKQEQIVYKNKQLARETQKIESNYQQKLNNLDELKKSILQKAFAGEL